MAERLPEEIIYAVNGAGDILAKDIVYNTRKQLESYSTKRQEYNKGSRSGRMFFFVNMEKIKGVKELGLTNKQIGQYAQLATYADYDGYLIRANGSEEPLYKLKDVAKVLGIKSPDTVRKFRNTLLGIGLMYEDVYTTQAGDFAKAYRLNPDYVYRGKVKTKSVVKAYSTAIRELYTQAGPNAVGIVIKLLPFVSIDNVLSHNPLEADTALLEPFTYEDMAKALGCNVTEARRHVTSITYNNMRVIALGRRAGKKVFTLNPALFNRKAVEADAGALEPFTINAIKPNKDLQEDSYFKQSMSLLS